MTAAQFLAIIHNTEDYGWLTVAGAVAILNNNGDQYHRHLLAAELNAAWNGSESNPLPSDSFGSDIYHKAGSSLNGLTIDQIDHMAYVSSNPSQDLQDYVNYAGSDGESCGSGTCRVSPGSSCDQSPPTKTATPKPTSTSTPKKTATPTPKGGCH